MLEKLSFIPKKRCHSEVAESRFIDPCVFLDCRITYVSHNDELFNKNNLVIEFLNNVRVSR